MLKPRRLAHLLLLLFLPAWAVAAGLKPLGPLRTDAKAELEVTGVPSLGNPFDPDDIAVEVRITSPSGRTWVQPAYWHQDYNRSLVAGQERLEPAGTPGWRVRFLPQEPGSHRLRLSIRIPNTPSSDLETTVEVSPGAGGRGYVRRSPEHRGDLATEDGRPLRLVGANYCWPEAGGTYDYDRWFNLLHRSGGNYARLWLAPWWIGLEHQPGRLNRYPLDEAWRLDHIVEQAEGNGIYLVLCLDHHGMYQVSNQNWGGSNNFWATNPYSVQAGGPCEKPNDFFTSEAARKTYQKRLRYLIARYGYSTSLLSWQFFNEIDNTFIQQVKAPDVLAWHQIMGRWLRTHDPMGHLISTSMTGGADQPDFWKLPEMDFTVYHSYQDPAPARKLAQLTADFVSRYGKPVVVGEFGVDARSWNIAIDPHLRGFRQCLWGAAMGGSAGPAHSWWWEDLERNGAYPIVQAFSEIMAQAGWNEGEWRPAKVTQNLNAPEELQVAPADARPFTANLALNPGRRLPLRGTVAIASPLAAERASEYVSAFLYGTRNPQLPSKMTLRVAAGPAARLVLKVNAVASDNQLVVKVGSEEVLRTGFLNRDNQAQMNGEINQEFPLALPPGLQTIEIANIGHDWTGLEALRLEGIKETAFADRWSFAPEVFALRSGAKAVAYIVSPHAVYPAGALRYQPPLVEAALVRLEDWPDGAYRVQWFDPETGALKSEIRTEAKSGSLTLDAPAFRADLVAVIAPAT